MSLRAAGALASFIYRRCSNTFRLQTFGLTYHMQFIANFSSLFAHFRTCIPKERQRCRWQVLMITTPENFVNLVIESKHPLRALRMHLMPDTHCLFISDYNHCDQHHVLRVRGEFMATDVVALHKY